MGMQVLVRATNVSAVEKALGDLSDQAEVFPVSEGLVGLSVPTRVLDTFGEERVRGLIARLPVYDLWAGEWRQPESE